MESTVNRSIRSSISLLFDTMFPVLILTAFAENGLFPIHYTALGIGVISACLILMSLDRKIQVRVFALALTAFLILSVVAGGWPVILIVCQGIFFFWRMLKRSDSSELSQITLIQLILFTLVFISMFSFQLTYEIYPANFLIIYLVAGIFLYSAAPYFSTYASKNGLVLFSKYAGLFLTLGAVIYLLAEPFRKLLFAAGDVAVAGVIRILYLTGADIEIPEAQMPEVETSSEEGDMYKPNPLNRQEIEETVGVNTLELIMLIAVIVLAAGAAWLLFKKFKQQPVLSGSANMDVTIERRRVKKDRDEKTTVPNHQIRKEILKLEQKARKNEAGRLKSETVREWFSRLKVQDYGYYAAIYEKVRYNDQDVLSEEQKAFEQFVKHFEKQIKKNQQRSDS
ncbi:hypothetical protein KP77_16480 [Jeotgalibacillus alimentarius]|uniref:DUF4129 domain-containing protein n=1 Tax=Jeotgalibacillus alimentarius TaxID=135826 RepID=A0A0C2W2D7_9BACL|nr:hypothetical protein [Jeotgalibacillus alimentarius]KIL50273.1 hypothetical protein KP77_16480 [Jeotgalibacillus alimentarius]